MSWIHVDYNIEYWVEIPMESDWGETPWRSEKAWGRSAATALREYRGLPDSKKEAKNLAKALVAHRQALTESNLAREYYLHFSDPEARPLPVHLWYGPADGPREDALRKHARVESSDAMLPPQSVEFSNESFGRGLKTRTHVVLDDETVAMNLWYAFRNDEYGVDLIVSSSSGDIGRLADAEPRLDEFVQGIWILGDNVDLLAEAGEESPVSE
ncbi:hypothetical protein [Streptomyces sp. bgisy100]|uniref:hypothetical protein n=1 Tax=Streptomyces sp. bgisy100 TaxID=3413783 RepID=UPI003D74DCBC